MVRRINVKDYDFSVPYNDIKLYRTKKEAEKAALALGWTSHNIMMLEKRFEKGYFVGQWFIHGESMYSSTFDCFTFPLYTWEVINGVKHMKIGKAIARTARTKTFD